MHYKLDQAGASGNELLYCNDEYYIALGTSNGFAKLGRVQYIEAKRCLQLTSEILVDPAVLKIFRRVLGLVAVAV